jgi:hypothetical protein
LKLVNDITSNYFTKYKQETIMTRIASTLHHKGRCLINLEIYLIQNFNNTKGRKDTMRSFKINFTEQNYTSIHQAFINDLSSWKDIC